jgi:YHS domain-containing protein
MMSQVALRYKLYCSIAGILCLLFGAGCGGSAAPGGDGAGSDVRAELAKLPPQDRALAERQKVCPVSGEPLGSMGVPHKVAIQGRTVFLCCKGCEEELRRNADKYLAKLDRSPDKVGGSR